MARKRKRLGRLLLPDRRYASVMDMDLAELKSDGIRYLLLDLDNTILPRDTGVIEQELRDWTAAAREAGIGICIVSNNWHARVSEVAEELGCNLVARAVKPLPFAFLSALRKLGAKRHQTAVVGDQLFTDVLGGNLLGLETVMVEPLSESDLPHTLFLRRIEALVLRSSPAPRRRTAGEEDAGGSER